MATARNSGMLQYNTGAINPSATYSKDACLSTNPDSLDNYFGGVLPKAPTTGQRPVYRAWFVPTALAANATAGLVTVNVTPTWGGVGGALSALTVAVANINAGQGQTVTGTLYVELMHSIVK